ncbi:hypothetical protein MA16_Dca001716 [Dendrobium catenatum]|uniref:Uncharacterized protein n=1 Tax=Dendrobium catenatum TaxID=906689 RepID=A0A2I0WN68_9ASPA|nr:hypothetical protein MA16_Dca001716 [Dendrobium catenatum]
MVVKKPPETDRNNLFPMRFMPAANKPPVVFKTAGKFILISAGNSWGSTGQNQSTAKKNSKPLNFCDLPESCLMSSSVYYGGRDDYIPQTSATHNSGAHYSYKKQNKEEDSGNSDVATRGDWWQDLNGGVDLIVIAIYVFSYVRVAIGIVLESY